MRLGHIVHEAHCVHAPRPDSQGLELGLHNGTGTHCVPGLLRYSARHRVKVRLRV